MPLVNLFGFGAPFNYTCKRFRPMVTAANKSDKDFVYLKKNTAMIIERTPNEIIFRFPRSMNLDDLQDLTDLFEYKDLTKNSEASQRDVNDLVKTIKKGRWERTKQQLD